MPIVLQDEDIIIDVGEGQFVFSPLSLNSFLGIAERGELEKFSKEQFMELLLGNLKSWKGIVDVEGKEAECTPNNFMKRLPGGVALIVIKKYADACGITEDFEKNFGELLSPKENSAA